ncbi:fimbrial protein [Citrobacter amalonaticus]|uniref:fimbrial protein n=2 Tax=Citrobacter TaxID=544 RepID=UPI001903EA9B|nr:fimbrial protein [Citrobacter amalonaticus]MBJ9865025.1 type 1 fimbrial protein [Citrobacter amalonaticus]
MQIKYVSLSACFGMALLSIPAIAPDTGTITFTGSIVGTTCNVNIGGVGKNADVSLRFGNATALVAPGSTDGDTRFSLQLSGCAGGAPEATAAKAFFQPGSTVTADGRLMNTAVTDAATKLTEQKVRSERGAEVRNSCLHWGGLNNWNCSQQIACVLPG